MTKLQEDEKQRRRRLEKWKEAEKARRLKDADACRKERGRYLMEAPVARFFEEAAKFHREAAMALKQTRLNVALAEEKRFAQEWKTLYRSRKNERATEEETATTGHAGGKSLWLRPAQAWSPVPSKERTDEPESLPAPCPTSGPGRETTRTGNTRYPRSGIGECQQG